MELNILGFKIRPVIVLLCIFVGMMIGAFALCSCSKITLEQVKEGLALVDKAIIKLDSGDSILMEKINQPKRNFPIEKLMENIENFEGNLIFQTMFLKGCAERKAFDNSCGALLDQWLEKIEELNPKEVMIYSLDRDTPIGTLEKIQKNELEAIAEKVAEFNIVTTVV